MSMLFNFAAACLIFVTASMRSCATQNCNAVVKSHVHSPSYRDMVYIFSILPSVLDWLTKYVA